MSILSFACTANETLPRALCSSNRESILLPILLIRCPETEKWSNRWLPGGLHCWMDFSIDLLGNPTIFREKHCITSKLTKSSWERTLFSIKIFSLIWSIENSGWRLYNTRFSIQIRKMRLKYPQVAVWKTTTPYQCTMLFHSLHDPFRLKYTFHHS